MADSPAKPGIEGGRYRPIPDANLPQLDRAIRHVLAKIGFSESPPIMIDTITANGGSLTADGRLLFPEALLDRFLAGYQRDWILYGQKPEHDLKLSGKRVHLGTSGAAPQVVDFETGRYRDSTLQDLYDAARICDTLNNIHFFSRCLVARDMPNDLLMDLTFQTSVKAALWSAIVQSSISHKGAIVDNIKNNRVPFVLEHPDGEAAGQFLARLHEWATVG